MSAYTDHLADRLRRSTWLVEISTTLLSDGSDVTLRYSSDKFATSPTDSPANAVYEARIINPLSLVLEAGDQDATGGLPALRGGSLRLGSRAGDLEALPEIYALQGSRVRVLLGGYTPSTLHWMTYAEYGELGVLEVDSVESQPDEMVLGLRDLSYRLDDRLEDRLLGGRDHCGRFGAGVFTRIGYAAPAKLDITGDVTVEAWVYLEAVGVGGQLICGWRQGTGRPWAMWVGNGGELSYLDSSQGASTSGTLAAHRWYHVAIVRTAAAGTITFYWRAWGGADHTETVSGLTFPAPAAGGVAAVDIGHNVSGLISDVRVWSTARTANQVRARRTFPIQVATEINAGDLKLYVRLDESTADSSASPATASTTGTATYLPTCDGDDGVAGTPVPVVLGRALHSAPVLADSRKLIYVAADRGASVAALVAREGGLGITAGSNRANLITLVTTVPTAGTYDWHLSANGAYVRLGSTPTKPVGVDVTMSVTIVDDVIEDLITTRGNQPFPGGELDLDLGAKLPAVDYCSRAASATIRDALEYLLSGLGVYWVTRAGALAVRSLPAPAGPAAVTLTSASVIEWEELERIQPVWRHGLRCRRNWQPLEGDALAGALVGTEAEPFYRREWRTAFRTEDRRAKWPRSRTIERDTAIATYSEAMWIATERLDLLQHPSRRIRVDAVLDAAVIERYDIVELDVSMPAVGSGQVERLTGLWVALGISEDHAAGRQSLTLWRPLT